jgi:Rrf2 family iron-sulfur cluster assembly transcriptional regulator
LLSHTCEYAVRAVSYIATHQQEGKPVLAKHISTQCHVPLKYLQKLLGELVRTETLTSVRGIGGGYRLARPAEDIPLLEILAPFDDTLHQTTCPFGKPRCDDDDPCPAHANWKPVVSAYKEFMRKTTVQDLVLDPSAFPLDWPVAAHARGLSNAAPPAR